MFENKLKKNKGKLLHIEIIPSFFFLVYQVTQKPTLQHIGKLLIDVLGAWKVLPLDTVNWVSTASKDVPGTIGVTSDTTVSSATTAINLPIAYRQYCVPVDGLVLHGVLVAVTMLWRINPDVIGCIIRNEMKNNNNRKIFFFFPLMMTMSKHKDSL